MCDRSLREPFDDVESDLVRFRVERKPWVSQHISFFVMDVLQINLPRVVSDAQGLEGLKVTPLIVLAQLLQTLNVFFKEPCVCHVADSLNLCFFSPDSSLQLIVLLVSLLPPPGY